MQRWEYRTVKIGTGGFLGGAIDASEVDQTLNALGNEGWELVSAFDTSYGQGGSRDAILILKRPWQ